VQQRTAETLSARLYPEKLCKGENLNFTISFLKISKNALKIQVKTLYHYYTVVGLNEPGRGSDQTKELIMVKPKNVGYLHPCICRYRSKACML